MTTGLSAAWTSVDPFFEGLKLGGLMNQSLEQDDTYRQGRHHFMTAMNQILEWGLALEQVSRYLTAANMQYPLGGWYAARLIVPLGASYLASCQIRVLHITEMANFVQDHWGKVSFVAMTVSSVALYTLGHTVIATTTLAYLSVGLLSRHNILPLSAQNALQKADFIIGNVAGLYLGGNFVRLICALNLVIGAVQKYFEVKRLAGEKTRLKEGVPGLELDEMSEDIEEDEDVNALISLDELKRLSNWDICPMRKSHIHKKPLPPVDESVQIDDLLDLYDEIDWSKHEHIIVKKLQKDKRWLEVGQFKSTPLKYFEKNLHHLIKSIKNREILEGKPASYDMLEFYCRFIAQELKEQDEMTQADMLIWLGVEAGDYCGTGKFGVVEEVYESLLAQASGLPLEVRVLACIQQERVGKWQNIYLLLWKTNPLTQLFGYLSDVNAIHNANVFMNLVQAGKKFGIPHQAAKNDQTATINPITHYLAFTFVNEINDCFWKGGMIPQMYYEVKQPMAGDWWKAWKWFHYKSEDAEVEPYNEEAILQRFIDTIGTPQIPKSDIYVWWAQWVDRQEDLSDETKEVLTAELQAVPTKDKSGKVITTFNGEDFEVDGKIQPKFLKAMLIEMGPLDKPWKLVSDVEVDYDEDALLDISKLD